MRFIAFYPSLILLVLGFVLSSPSLFGNEEYDDRVETFINSNMDVPSVDALVLRAFRGLPLDESTIQVLLDQASISPEADFRLTNLLRILLLTNGEYEAQIIPVIEKLPYWLPDPDNLRQYWSENHMIMWMSADWLMHENYGKATRPTLRDNLLHWLNLKIEYGYYEYFSSVYFPFTTAGLLNLVDFAQDEEIVELAEKAVTRLLQDVLLLVNDKGVYYPTAGRNEVSRYLSPYGSNIQKLIYLLTGLGEAPSSPGIGVSALATSSLNVDAIIDSWNPKINQTYKCGHPLSESENIHGHLSREDRIVFDWSSGAYFHPLVATNTLWQIRNYNMWTHEEFRPYSFGQYFPVSIGKTFANLAASFTRSSYIGQANIEIYKNNGVVLTSSQKQWEGRLGYQIWPIAATVETSCVFIRSGEVVEWSEIPSRRSNEHLPYVEQDDNVALVMYRQNVDLPFWGYNQSDVALYFQEDEYDELKHFDNWIVGRKDESFVAVKKHCNDIINGVSGCPDDDGQTWAIVVGNSETHENFDNFVSIIEASVYEESWHFDWKNFKWVYYGRIKVDGKDIDHYWEGSWLAGPNNNGNRIDNVSKEALENESDSFVLFPNPANNQFSIFNHNTENNIESISIMNMKGQIIYEQHIETTNTNINVANLPNGIYTLIIDISENNRQIKRLIVQH